MKEGEPPWRASYGSTVQRVLKEDPRTVVMIDSPIGLVPYSLEDLSPWCRVEGSNYIEFIPGILTTVDSSLGSGNSSPDLTMILNMNRINRYWHGLTGALS